MRHYLLDEYRLRCVTNERHQAKGVASDVENGELLLGDVVGAGEVFAQLAKILELPFPQLLVPSSKWRFGLGMLSPEGAQGARGDDVHKQVYVINT